MRSRPPFPPPPFRPPAASRRPARLDGGKRLSLHGNPPDEADADADGIDRATGAPGLGPVHHKSVFDRVTHPQISTKKAAHQSAMFLAGFEIAVKVNHVDPLNDGRRDVKSSWVADGENAAVDLESVIKRKQLPHDMALELQGPALTARADEDSLLPLRARFVGVGFSKQFSEDMPHDDTPPRVEVKVEIKLTEKSIGSLAGLAGASQELQLYAAELAATPAATVIGNVLTNAVPVVSSIVAGISVHRAGKTLRDSEAPLSTKTLAVLRAVADVTTVFFPLLGTLGNMALVGAAIGLARFRAKRAVSAPPSTGPPSASGSPPERTTKGGS